MAAPSPVATPKRKRSQLLDDDNPSLNTSPTTKFSFEVTPSLALDDGSASPRSKVAHKFRGLALDSGGGVEVSAAGAPRAGRTSRSPGQEREKATEAMDVDADFEIGVRKRVKLPGPEVEIARASGIWEGTKAVPDADPGRDEATLFNPEVPGDAGLRAHLRGASPPLAGGLALDPAVVRSVEFTTTLPKRHTATSSASLAGPADSKPRPRKRAGTPPLHAVRRSTPPSTASPSGNPSGSTTAPAPSSVVDPLRASLTWHEDEITIYDPDDSDDDGTGINGIGFKPTPAIAYARTIKRRQQLAEYRKREEREARARRSQRRRGSPAVTGLVALKEKVSARKVRFTEEPGVRVC